MSINPRPSSPSVLIVEDEKLVIWSLAKSLRKAGFSVTAVQCGEHALQELSSRSYDAVITDMDLPRINGLQVAEKAKSLYPSLPVILMSASAISISESDRKQKPYDYFIEKPFDLKEVISLVESCAVRDKTD